MARIKEIKKIESPIKEIKKLKIDSLEDELDEEPETAEDNSDNVRVRKFGKSSALDASETPQEAVPRVRRIAKEDEEEVRFRPSYTPGNQNQQNKYTPVGAAESSAVPGEMRSIGGERTLDINRERQLPQPQGQHTDTMSWGGGGQQSGEIAGERPYVAEREQKKERRR